MSNSRPMRAGALALRAAILALAVPCVCGGTAFAQRTPAPALVEPAPPLATFADFAGLAERAGARPGERSGSTWAWSRTSTSTGSVMGPIQSVGTGG